MSAIHEDRPSQSSTPKRPLPRRSRSHPDSMDCDHMHEEHQRSSSTPQHHQLTPKQSVNSGAQHAFDFFYSLVFSLVHAALTIFLAPVLRKDRRRTASSKVRRSPSWRSCYSAESDPELAIPERGDDSTSSRSTTTSSSGGSYHQPILKTQSSRLSSENKKSVRFPAPERSRPPLGRIGVGSSSSSVSSSSTGSSSSRSSGGRRERSSSRTGSSNGSMSRTTTPLRSDRRTSSPFGRMTSPRMSHSAYFLE
eukprot:CAMPEP_0172315078 /NCGR_PEP_ID=MMETSP1058-20130122/24046_1 /TAXON_ID=83371 /ORGANISM="Detonula confervacea, Strain CCMP 353" /LENGTH=250 /DNA_ID=CAMNT_0013029075 /DNA_START=65 /DNA_END=817 /DNA_ORIENTATION=+